MERRRTVLVVAPGDSGLAASFGSDWSVIEAKDTLSALRAAGEQIDVLVVSSQMPEGGLDVVRALKNRLGAGTPSILVGGYWDRIWVESALLAGATDLAIAPASGELQARALIAVHKRQVDRANLLAMAYTDDLTGLPNRRYLQDKLQAAILTSRARQEPLSILLLDIDKFKQINDCFGHRAGDRALVEFAKVLRASSRATDIFGRWGGEEFVYILPGALAIAEIQAERVRHAVAAFPFGAPDLDLRLTISIGATELLADDHLTELVDRADRLLYQAKDSGRDRTMSGCVA